MSALYIDRQNYPVGVSVALIGAGTTITTVTNFLKRFGVAMNISTTKFLLCAPLSTLIVSCWGSELLYAREGYDEPPRQASYDQSGRLRINRDFFELSANTGGDFYFWAPGEFAASAAILRVPVTSDPIFLEYGNSDKFVRSCKIPVDSGIGLLNVLVEGYERAAPQLWTNSAVETRP